MIEKADWLTDWLTDRLRDRERDRQTDRLTDWLRDRETEREKERETDRQTDWLTDRQTDWQTDWLTDRETDRQTDRQTKQGKQEPWTISRRKIDVSWYVKNHSCVLMCPFIYVSLYVTPYMGMSPFASRPKLNMCPYPLYVSLYVSFPRKKKQGYLHWPLVRSFASCPACAHDCTHL